VYIGHPGWKAAGGRTSYSLASGVVIALMCFLGMFSLLGALLPLPAIVPILLYIGLLIGAQAFQEVPKAHCVAVVMAIIPNIASWATGLQNNALAAVGTSADKVGAEALANAGLVYHGTALLGGGAILAGLVLGSIVAFVIDKNFLAAAAYCLAGSVLGFVGLIHAEHVGWNVGGQIALGYLLAALVLVGYWAVNRRTSAADTAADGADVREDQPVAADLAMPEPGAGVPVPRSSADRREGDRVDAPAVVDGRSPT
jgi:AGZA family xanthine/uracil permease-like MFS transporter